MEERLPYSENPFIFTTQPKMSQDLLLNAVKNRLFIVGSIDIKGEVSVAAHPTVYGYESLAEDEAARLASVYKGKAYVVLQFVGGAISGGVTKF